MTVQRFLKQMATACAGKAARFIGLYTSREWLLLVLPFAIFVSFVVGVGPQFQVAALSLLDSGAPSYFEAAYQNSIPVFPDLGVWLLASANVPTIVIALIVSIYSLRARKLKSVLVSVAISLWISYSIFDTAVILFSDSIDMGSILLNIASNLVGGVILAALSAIVLSLYRTLKQLSDGMGYISMITPCISLIASGLIVSSLIHLTSRILYNPIPIEVTLESEGALSAFYATTSRPPRKDDEDPTEEFSWIGNHPITSRVIVEPFRSNPKAAWRKGAGDRHFRVEVRLFADCFGGASERRAAEGTPFLSVNDAQSFDIALLEGPSALIIVPENGATYTQHGYGSGIVFTSSTVNDGETTRSLSVTTIDNEIGLISSFRDSTVFVVRPALFDFDREVMAPAGKAVEFSLDGKSYRLQALPVPRERYDEAPRCRNVSGNISEGGGGALTLDDPVVVLELIFSVIAGPEELRAFERGGHQLTIPPFSGNLMISDAGDDRGSGTSAGLGRLSGRTTKGTLTVDGTTTTLTNRDTINLTGRLNSVHLDDRTIVSGTADTAWRNQTRLNRTKWERLSSDWQLWIIGGLCGALVAAWGFGRKFITDVLEEDVQSWI